MLKSFVLPDNVIDKNKTARRTRKFLIYDLERYLAIAGMQREDLLTPSKIRIDVVSDENEYISQMISVQILVKCVACSIKSLPNYERHPYKTLIECAYIDCLPSMEIENKIGYSPSQCRQFKNIALNQFALNFVYYQLKNNILNPIDLCNYEIGFSKSKNTIRV